MPKIIRPQPGPQEQALSSKADILIYGGAAGSGKSWALLLEAIRYKNVKGFNATIFRTQFTDLIRAGSLWEESYKLYGDIKGAQARVGDKQWVFHDKNGEVTSKVTFAHLNDINLQTWKGSQLCLIGYDELCDFSENQFFFMLSRNRSLCGVSPYIRGTCNPDPDSWVARFISWWIDQDTGYPIKERSGVLRWMIRRDEKIYWADRVEDLWEQFGLNTPEERMEPKSVTFIAASIYDNQELLKVNPQYLGNLKAMGEIDRERFLNGNWKIKASAGLYFRREQINSVLDYAPTDVVAWVRCWDLAATAEKDNENAAFTAGVLMGKRNNGRYVVADVINARMSAQDVRSTIRQTARDDCERFRRVKIRLPQDPGQAGKEQAQSYIKFLAGFNVRVVPESGSKETRAEPMAAQWQAGNFDIVRADWNKPYLDQLESFPEGKFKDMVDASANAFAELEVKNTFNVRNFLN